MPFNDGIEIIGLIQALFRAQEYAPNHVPQDHLQILTIFLIHGQQKCRNHRENHQQCGHGVTQRLSGQEEQRNANQQAAAEADQLPLGQVEQHLGFDLGNVLRDGYIGYSEPSFHDCAINVH